MTQRFRQADDRTIPFSEIKPERLAPVDPRLADRRRLDALRGDLREDIPLAE